MKQCHLAILLACATVVIASTMCCAATATITIYHGTNYIAAPLVPFDPNPASVFAGFPIDGRLKRFEVSTQDFVYYTATNQTAFGNILLGDGYIIENDGPTQTVTYEGVPDGVPGQDGEMTDMWLPVPCVGSTLIGNPFYHTVPFNCLLATDGTRLYSWPEAVEAGWFDMYWLGLDNATQDAIVVGPEWSNAGVNAIAPCSSYWVRSYVPNLAIIVPATPVPEPPCLIALAVGLAGVMRFRRR